VTIRFRSKAARDLLEAKNWYENQREGLGLEFVDAIMGVVARVDATPAQFPRVRGETRRALLRRFPYAIYFIVEGDHRVVLAVLHQAANPMRLRRR
jgi:toxin ParE1/3/4